MKSNIHGKLVPFHEATIIALATISPDWKHPQIAMFTIGTVLKQARIPQDAHAVAVAFSETMDRLRLEHLDPLDDIHTSILTQMLMGDQDAVTHFAPFHNVLVAQLSALFVKEETAGAKFRALLHLMDIAIIPEPAIAVLYEVARHKMLELKLEHKAWVIGPIEGLRRRLPETHLDNPGHHDASRKAPDMAATAAD